jgi:hypothetical protein
LESGLLEGADCADASAAGVAGDVLAGAAGVGAFVASVEASEFPHPTVTVPSTMIKRIKSELFIL